MLEICGTYRCFMRDRFTGTTQGQSILVNQFLRFHTNRIQICGETLPLFITRSSYWEVHISFQESLFVTNLRKYNGKYIDSIVTESKLLWTSSECLFAAVGFTPKGITTRPFLVQMLVANTIPRSACPSKIWAQTQCITNFERKFSYWLLMVLGFERSLMVLSRQTNPAMEYTDWNHVSESHFKRHLSVWFRRR